ncbi:MAG: VWA domain-containing protein [Candidatus Bathyarchaeia archaeon]
MRVCITIIMLLTLPLMSLPSGQSQVVGTVVTTKTITPSIALPGQTMTVKINITVTSGAVGVTGPVDSSLVIDRTGSMYGQKFEDAKTAAKAFVDDQRAQDRSQVIAFAEDAIIQKDFTTTDSSGKAALKQAIDQIIPPYGFTNLYAALELSIQEMLAKGMTGHKKAILLMTDGRPTIGVTSSQQFVDLARSAASSGIVIYTIGLGGAGPDPVNATLLQDIANAGGGKYYFAPTSSELRDIYLEISAEVHGPPATNVRVTENLPTSLVTYNNDASIPPNSTSDGTIFWQVPEIPAATSWVVTFTVTAQRRVVVVHSITPTTIIYDRAGQVDIRIDLPPGIATREVAVTSIASDKERASVGDVVKFNATVFNYGTIAETFTVGLFANNTMVKATPVSLTSGGGTVVSFEWNTTDATTGTYNMSIIADPDRTVFGDDPTNNTKSVRLDLSPKYESTILPLVVMILIPIAIIPLVAAALLGRRRGYGARTVPGTLKGRYLAVCPTCNRPLTYYTSYQRWYCPYCRKYK